MPYGQFAYIYDRLMDDMPYPQWVRFIRGCWESYGKPKTVADLGCGTGNISIPLAQSGLQVFAIDLSDDMLAVAQDKTEQQQRLFPFAPGGAVTWLQQDMREWELAEPVDSVISCCDSINYLTEEEDLALLFRQTYAGLKDGGTFIFDVHTEGQLISYADMQPFTLNDDDVSYIWTSDLDEERCEIEHDLTIFVREAEWFPQQTQADAVANAGEDEMPRYIRIDERHVQRAYPLSRLEQLLQQAGFSQVHLFADFVRKAPTAETERAFFVCVKG
ncbi:class I SAM-dependent DNA methyltransferase [Paenibacillus ginsengarvi]|uniref:Class I SAM-dependent methyltransferase n=1 Tax=Paenibacillus ginsengarvi TaxID=400777 RepID=A0A3B0C484_9BACL|nr:class I SAM-dependent methyltransferase [Paenibacillus ginsengarvi]RKN79049.1 class I SAM-dependent methyltransferase [Paenibacillus ginsengarvi]